MKDNMTPQEYGEWLAINALKWIAIIIVVAMLIVHC